MLLKFQLLWLWLFNVPWNICTIIYLFWYLHLTFFSISGKDCGLKIFIKFSGYDGHLEVFLWIWVSFKLFVFRVKLKSSTSVLVINIWEQYYYLHIILKSVFLGQQDGSVGKGIIVEPDDFSSITRTHMMERENWLPHVVLWPSHSYYDMRVHTCIDMFI